MAASWVAENQLFCINLDILAVSSWGFKPLRESRSLILMATSGVSGRMIFQSPSNPGIKNAWNNISYMMIRLTKLLFSFRYFIIGNFPPVNPLLLSLAWVEVQTGGGLSEAGGADSPTASSAKFLGTYWVSAGIGLKAELAFSPRWQIISQKS